MYQMRDMKLKYLLSPKRLKNLPSSGDSSRKNEKSLPMIINESIINHGSQDITFDANLLSESLFPLFNGVIFISHLSSDEERALTVKEKIVHETGCKCFVDSEVWRNVYAAIEKTQLSYAQKVPSCKNTYYLESCNVISMNLSLILSHAILKALMNASAFIYIPPKSFIADQQGEIKLSSPWVTLELIASRLLEQLWKAEANDVEKIACSMVNESVSYQFTVPVDHLITGTLKDLIDQINDKRHN